MDAKTIHKNLNKVGYWSNDAIDYSLLVAMTCEKPLLLEGAPGVGKTFLAKAFAKSMNLPFIRVQLYDGLTDDKILYDYDYQKQLLTLEAIKPNLNKELENLSVKDSISKVSKDMNFYGKDFLIERPVLKAINGSGRKVLLFDEMDKAPEEIEYMLFEFLENYSISIPQYGEIRCPEDQKPYVFITSNRYRDLSGAMKRRCLYLYIPQKTKEELVHILMSQTEINQDLANGIAKCLITAQNSNMKQSPSVAEGIEWAKFLSQGDITKERVMNSLGVLAKNADDLQVIKRIVEGTDPIYG